MNHRQRLETCISGKDIDRPPVALWRHFPVDDQDPTSLARSILEFQSAFDFDFVKVTPASSFCVKDYGVVDVWKGNPEGTREYLDYPVKSPVDWAKLTRLSPQEGSLGNQLKCLQSILHEVDRATPVVQTVFDPMSQAKNLVGRENLFVHLRQSPDALLNGLEILTENTLSFIRECVNMGIDGIFFAIQHAQSSLLSVEEVKKFVLPFDEMIINHISDLWLNVLHLHGKDIYFDIIPKNGFAIVNWHDQETPPSLPSAKLSFPGAVCGGLKQWETLVYGTPALAKTEAAQAIHSTRGERFILGTGCVLPIIAPRANIQAVRMAVEE